MISSIGNLPQMASVLTPAEFLGGGLDTYRNIIFLSGNHGGGEIKSLIGTFFSLTAGLAGSEDLLFARMLEDARLLGSYALSLRERLRSCRR